MTILAKKNKIESTSRYLAVQILDEIETKGAYSNLLLRKTIDQNELSADEANLLTELVYGVLQNLMTLDYQLQPFVKKQKKLETWVLQLLRISLYQKVYLDRIPDHAIVNEAVEIAKARGHKGIVGLVNAILRNIQRKGVADPAQIKDARQRLSIQYSLPQWLVDEFIEELGMEETELLAISLNKRPSLSLRVNTKEISRAEAVEQLTAEGYEAELSDVSPFGIIVNNGLPVSSTLFTEGKIAVQDESSMLVAPALNVAENHAVLDACAAPGGKTMHIASEFLTAAKGGKVTALDIHPHKINLIKDNAKRQNLNDRVETMELDARTITDKFAENSFDRILVDAPCSGLGLMRRRPEIRYNKTKKDILSLQKLQIQILEEVSKTLKSGGELVYSTCTLTRVENQEVLAKFLENNTDFKLQAVNLPDNDLKHNDDGTITIYPHQHGTDGFFISNLIKQ